MNWRIWTALLALALAACATVPAGESRTYVEATNHGWDDVRVYADRNGALLRLGYVGSQATERLRIPADVVRTGRLCLVLRPLARTRSWAMDCHLFRAGERLRLSIESHLPFSAFGPPR
jgi:hypothetical protein